MSLSSDACVHSSPSAPQTLLGQSQDVVTQRLQRFSLEQLRSYASTCEPYDGLRSQGVVVVSAQWVTLYITQINTNVCVVVSLDLFITLCV